MSLTEKQLAMRRTGITATDVRVLSGTDPYGRTAHDVWSSKVLGVDDFQETEAIELGQALEPIVIPRLAKKVGMHVLRIDPEKLTMRHHTIAHHIATPDALLARHAFVDPEATAQVKVCGLHVAGSWGRDSDGAEGVPDHVLVQDAWEMHVSRQPVSFVGALIGTEVRAYRIELTPDIAHLIEALIEVADRFWVDHVLTKRPPTVDGTEGSRRMLKSLFPRHTGPLVQASDEVAALAAEYFARKTHKEHAEQLLEESRQLLITACGESEGIVGEGWRLLHKRRDGYTVNPSPYTVPAQRHFDLRKVQPKARAKKQEAA